MMDSTQSVQELWCPVRQRSMQTSSVDDFICDHRVQYGNSTQSVQELWCPVRQRSMQTSSVDDFICDHRVQYGNQDRIAGSILFGSVGTE